ncbi:MAG TPA: ComEC/Rec2 family competence protein, partial [Blastocatellia bacterium]|nr:ComEC/Rec2 family competence protein [Blastocatellia bacterium]
MSCLQTDSALSLRKQPFVYITLLFVTGILIDNWLRVPRSVPFALVAVAAVLSAWFITTKRDAASTSVILIGFAAAGCLVSVAARLNVAPNRLEHLFSTGVINADDPVELVGVLSHPAEPMPDARLLDVEAESLSFKNGSIPASGHTLLIISIRDSQAAAELERLNLDYGSRVRILLRLGRAQSYSNPGSPDFNDFLERRNYDLKGDIKSPLLIEALGSARINPILALLYHFRAGLMKRIDDRFPPNVAGTLKAMLAGNRYFDDPSTVTRLREGATFHTLVIAGLHIGIIAWLLLGGREAKRRGIIRVLFALTVLWAYAVMAGMAPPVARTTVMISVGIVGPLLFRRAISLNTVALAAFLMLAVQPELAGDAGFQMSFAAVVGIVALAMPFV